MTKITFNNSLTALDYEMNLKKLGFCSVPSPEMVNAECFCRENNEVYIAIKTR